MAFTLIQGVQEVRSLINESSASYWSDTELESWIKQGCLDWCEKITNQYQYTASTSNYIDNAIRTLHAEYNNIALKRLTFEEIRGHNQMVLTNDENPKYFYHRNTIRISK